MVWEPDGNIRGRGQRQSGGTGTAGLGLTALICCHTYGDNVRPRHLRCTPEWVRLNRSAQDLAAVILCRQGTVVPLLWGHEESGIQSAPRSLGPQAKWRGDSPAPTPPGQAAPAGRRAAVSPPRTR